MYMKVLNQYQLLIINVFVSILLILLGSFQAYANQPPVFVEDIVNVKDFQGVIYREVPEKRHLPRYFIDRPVEAIDEDGDTITYSITGADTSEFSIDKHTGQLKAKHIFDYEQNNVYL